MDGRLVGYKSMIVVVDCETTSLDEQKCELLGMGYYGENGDKGFLATNNEIREFFHKRANDKIVYHHGAFDTKVLSRSLGFLPIHSYWFDTRLAAAVLPGRPKKLDLETLCIKYLNSLPWKEDDFLSTMGEQDLEKVKDYCLKDCKETFNLMAELIARLTKAGLDKWFFEFMMPVARLAIQAEHNGIRVDQAKITELLDREQALKDSTLERFRMAYGRLLSEWEAKGKPFKINSPKAVLWLLRDQFKVPCVGPDKKVSTGKDVLELYKDHHPAVQDIVNIRGMEAKIGGFKKWLQIARDGDGRLRTHYNLDVAKTGRFSSSSPLNLQNIWRGEPRQCFTADPGKLLFIRDLGQVEPRVLAHLSQDPILIETFLTGQDFYAMLAKQTLGLEGTPNEIKSKSKHIRDLFKTIGLSIFYGIGPSRLAGYLSRGLGKKFSYNDALDIRETVRLSFPGICEYTERLLSDCLRQGYVQTLLGRRLYPKGDDIYHTIMNHVVQCSASDLCCEGEVRFDRALTAEGIYHKLLLFVHDETVNEINPEDEKRVTELAIQECSESFKLLVPVPIETFTGPNWGSK